MSLVILTSYCQKIIVSSGSRRLELKTSSLKFPLYRCVYVCQRESQNKYSIFIRRNRIFALIKFIRIRIKKKKKHKHKVEFSLLAQDSTF